MSSSLNLLTRVKVSFFFFFTFIINVSEGKKSPEETEGIRYNLRRTESTIFSAPKNKKLPKCYQMNPEEYVGIFFNIPIVKFWTSTMSYLLFLLLQAYPSITSINIVYLIFDDCKICIVEL